MSAGSDVAALVAQDLLGEAQARGFSLNEDEAPETVSDESAAAEEVVPQPAAEATEDPDLDVEEDDLFDLSAFKPVGEDTEEDDEEDVLPPAAVVEDDDEEEETDEYVDPEVKRLRAEIKKQARQLEHERTLRVESNSRKWRAKLETQFPLADFDSITATSRRSYERKVTESHNKHAKILAPQIEKLEAAKARLKEAGYADGKAEARQAWGKPTTGPQTTTLAASDYERGLEAVRKTGDLQKVIEYKRTHGRADE